MKQQAVDKKLSKIIYKESKKSIFVNILIIALVGMLSGVAIGLKIVNSGSTGDMYDIDPDTLYDNVLTIKEESNSKNPIELGAVKSAVLAIDTTFNEECVQVIGSGKVVSMGVTQSIQAKQIRLNDTSFFENVSVSSFVKAANRFYLKNGTIQKIKGNVSGNTVTWNGATSNLTEDEYRETMGLGINEYMSYVISSKTVTSSSDVSLNTDGNYEFSLKLDKVKSVVNYVVNMKETGGLGDYPKFSEDISIKIVMDSNYRILSFTSDEKYKVKKGMWMDAVGTLTNTFSYDGNFVIPNVSEKTKV